MALIFGPGRHWLLALALLASVGFIAFLHPATGALGGVLMIMTGWALPTIIVTMLSLWVCGFFEGRVLRLAVFFVVSWVVGLNVHLPGAIKQAFTSPQVDVRIDRRTHFAAGNILGPDKGGPRLNSRPMLASMSWGGDEGCMCLYFKDNPDTRYDLELLRSVNKISPAAFNDNHGLVPPGWTYEVLTEAGGRVATVRFRIVDEQGIAASFEQGDIPVDVPTAGEVGRGSLDSPGFLANAIEILLNNNLWVAVAGAYLPSLFDQTGFEDFLAKAVSIER